MNRNDPLNETYNYSPLIKRLEPKFDNVNSPIHYQNGRFETIELIEEIISGYKDPFVAHCVGTAVKYESRAPFKHGDGGLTDLKKAAKYLEFAISHMEKKNESGN